MKSGSPMALAPFLRSQLGLSMSLSQRGLLYPGSFSLHMVPSLQLQWLFPSLTPSGLGCQWPDFNSSGILYGFSTSCPDHCTRHNIKPHPKCPLVVCHLFPAGTDWWSPSSQGLGDYGEWKTISISLQMMRRSMKETKWVVWRRIGDWDLLR